MVKSKLNSNVNYSEIKILNVEDRDKEVALFEIELFDIPLLIALGEEKYTYSNEKIVIICADIEDQIMGLDNNERETFMKEIGLSKTGLNQLIKEGYELLNLDTFFTSGPEESRAWTVKKNTLAPKAASVIHTDFEKNFIRAETVTCEDFIKYGSAEKCKENGKLRIEGKDYIVKDGDVLYFRVNP